MQLQGVPTVHEAFVCRGEPQGRENKSINEAFNVKLPSVESSHHQSR